MPRFFVPDLPETTGSVALPAEAAHHAIRVLRLVVGDAVELFDGSGRVWPAMISSVTRQTVLAECAAPVPVSRESRLRITLLQGISSGDRMDYTLQKAVELGVARIVPLACERSVVRLSGERADKRRQNWQQLVVSACEQCQRNVVPQVSAVADFAQAMASMTGSTGFLMDPRAPASLRDLSPPSGEVALLAGPEGGFTTAEEIAAQQAGFVPVRFGPRILRTETAAVAAVSVLQALWGDLLD